MKQFYTQYQSLLFSFVLYALIATALLAPVASEQAIPAITDYANHLAYVIEAKMAFAEGQFPLRIAPIELAGWRYPIFQFYSPTTYTLAGLVYNWFTPSNPLLAIKFVLWLSLVLGGLSMQRLAYWLVKSRSAALLAGMVYITAPYYTIIITGLGNLCETLALGIVPAVIYYTLQSYLHYRNNKTIIQTGLAWYLLITIHMITFVYTALFLTILLLLITVKNKHHWKNLLTTGVGIAFGCLLAMWFLAPIVLLNNYFIMAQTFKNAAQFQSFGPFLSTLLFPGHLVFQGALGANHASIGWPILMAVCLCLYACFNKLRLSNVRANYWLSPLLILFFIVFMIVWSPFHFLPWAPSFLLIGQYCWRLLNQLIWIGSLLFAWSVCWLFKDKLDLKHMVIGVLLLIVTASASFPLLYSATFNINVADFIKKPYVTFNADAYTIEFNKHTGFVDSIDTMRLDTLMLNNTLQMDTSYALPQTLINYAKSPKLILKGTVPTILQTHTPLKAMLNDTTIATLTLSSGKFHWEIPLTSTLLSQFNHKKILNLQFKTNLVKPITIAIDELALTGFLQSATTLNVKTVQPLCHQQKTITVCKINVPQQIQLVELPILYYPTLLHITLNGQPVPYKGIVYQNNLIAGIKPIAGKSNLITIQFRGLMWANIVSWVSWISWIGLLIYSLLITYQKKKKTNDSIRRI